MEESWRIKCSSTMPSSAPSLASSSSLELRNHMENNTSYDSYPHDLHDLRRRVLGTTQGSMFSDYLNSSSQKSSNVGLGNSFLALLSGPPSVLQFDFNEYLNPRSTRDSNVVDSIRGGTALTFSGPPPVYPSQHNIQFGEDSCFSKLHNTVPSNAGNVQVSRVEESFHHSPSSLSNCPRVFCLATGGYLLISNTGLLGIVCTCHSLHMSVLKFCEHSGLSGCNAGDSIRLESGESIATWRKVYFQKFGIRIPEDQSDWDWPEGVTATSGLVKSRTNLPSISGNISHLTRPSEGLLRSGQISEPSLQKNQNLVSHALHDKQKNHFNSLFGTLQDARTTCQKSDFTLFKNAPNSVFVGGDAVFSNIELKLGQPYQSSQNFKTSFVNPSKFVSEPIMTDAADCHRLEIGQSLSRATGPCGPNPTLEQSYLKNNGFEIRNFNDAHRLEKSRGNIAQNAVVSLLSNPGMTKCGSSYVPWSDRNGFVRQSINTDLSSQRITDKGKGSKYASDGPHFMKDKEIETSSPYPFVSAELYQLPGPEARTFSNYIGNNMPSSASNLQADHVNCKYFTSSTCSLDQTSAVHREEDNCLSPHLLDDNSRILALKRILDLSNQQHTFWEVNSHLHRTVAESSVSREQCNGHSSLANSREVTELPPRAHLICPTNTNGCCDLSTLIQGIPVRAKQIDVQGQILNEPLQNEFSMSRSQNGEASVKVSSKFCQNHFTPNVEIHSVNQDAKSSGKISKNIVGQMSQWRDVPTKMKKVMCTDTSDTMRIKSSHKEHEKSMVSSESSFPEVTELSVDVSNMDSSNVDAENTGRLNNLVVDEGSGIDKCWSSDDALGSERSAEFLGDSWKSDSKNHSSRSLIDELKLINSLTWKKSHQTQTLQDEDNRRRTLPSTKKPIRKRDVYKLYDDKDGSANYATLEDSAGKKDKNDHSSALSLSPVEVEIHNGTRSTKKIKSVDCTNNFSFQWNPVVCGKYGEICNRDSIGDMEKPAKIVPLSTVLKYARKCTLPESQKSSLSSSGKLKNAHAKEDNESDSGLQCSDTEKDRRSHRDGKPYDETSLVSKHKCSAKDNKVSEELPMSKLEQNQRKKKDSGEEEDIFVHGQIKSKVEEIHKRSIYELTADGNRPRQQKSPLSDLSKCLPEFSESEGYMLRNGKNRLGKVGEKSPQERRSTSLVHSDSFCCVCGSSDKNEGNDLLECKTCFIRVHQACYGVSRHPKGHWYCRPCQTNSQNIVCVLCGYGDGAMTRALQSRSIVKSLLRVWNIDGGASASMELKMDNSITKGLVDSRTKQWVHMVCGLWTPGTRCPNVDTMSAFDVSGAPRPRSDMVCSICSRPGGSCIKCRVPNCSVPFHPWCAHQKGLLQSEVEGIDDENVGFYGRCQLHATHPMCETVSELVSGVEGTITCARTEDYKGRKRDGFWHNYGNQSKGKVGWHVPQEQLNAWNHIIGQRACRTVQSLPKPPVSSDTESDCRKEYIRYKQERGWKQLVVYKSDIHALGLYTSCFMSRGEMVVEYIGEIVGQRVSDKREIEYQSGRKLAYKSACYFFRIDKEHIIDATRKGGIARFVNHSCLPNCVAKVIPIRSEKKVIFFAERDIFPGEEITYDYHFNHEDEGKKIPCFCNSKNCRRYLN